MSKQKPYRFLATGTSVIAISALAVTGFGPSATASALTGNTASSSLAGKEILLYEPGQHRRHERDVQRHYEGGGQEQGQSRGY